MKRAKFMLAAVAALGLVGGIFAFKAGRVGDKIYVTGTTTALCNSTVFGYTTLRTAPTQPSAGFTRLATIAGPCTTTTSYYTGL